MIFFMLSYNYLFPFKIKGIRGKEKGEKERGLKRQILLKMRQKSKKKKGENLF